MNGAPDSLAARHLELRTAAITARLLQRLDESQQHGWFHRDDDPEERFPFLREYGDRLEELAGSRRNANPAQFAAMADETASRAEEPPPLARLLDAGLGGETAADVVVTAALVERDVRLGAVIAALQAPTASRRPCIGALVWLLGDDADVPTVVVALGAAGIVSIDDPDLPRAEQLIRLPPPVLDLVEGAPFTVAGLTHWPRVDAPELDELVVPAAIADRIERVAGLLDNDAIDGVIVRGAGGSGRRTVLRHLAGWLEQGLLVAEPDVAAAGPLAILTGSVLAWQVELTTGAQRTLPRPTGVPAVAVATGRRGAVALAGSDRVATIDLPMPTAEDRRRFWERADVGANDEVLDTVSERYALSGGTILQVADRAAAVARVDGRDDIRVDDVRAAAQDLSRPLLEAQATLLPPLGAGRAPVLAGAAAAEYESLVLRCRHREAVVDALAGTGTGGLTRGVRAMFTGPSGTGKTLAARALGARLDLDVYRADLAALVDKYIGETERRVDELLSRTEDLDVVLVLDEGDALMTRRTDVRTSNDRYANLETDFLLQRLESYEGIIVVTTNAAHLVDQAFLRRLDSIVAFTAPEVAERRAIWELHLPQGHRVPPELLDDLAARCRLTGGQIRNAVLHAALLAVEGGTAVNGNALVEAVAREYARSGSSSPLEAVPVTPSPFELALARSGR